MQPLYMSFRSDVMGSVRNLSVCNKTIRSLYILPAPPPQSYFPFYIKITLKILAIEHYTVTATVTVN
jgi:hypothetical protein